MQHLAIGTIERAPGPQVGQLALGLVGRPRTRQSAFVISANSMSRHARTLWGAFVISAHGISRHAKCPTPCLRCIRRQHQAVVPRQIARVLRRAAARQVSRRGHGLAAVVGQTDADQRRIGQIAHAHRAVVALGRQLDHAVRQVERNAQARVFGMKGRHQRRHVPAPEAGRRRQPQVAAGLHAAGRHAGLGARHVGQEALAVVQKRSALMRQRDAPRGAHQQLDAQVFFQRVEPAADHGRRHALGARGGA